MTSIETVSYTHLGATVYVPLFVEQGETIVIDTRTGEYSKRV